MRHLIFALVAALSLAGETTYDLLWHPEPHQKLRYALLVKGAFGDRDFEFKSDVFLDIKSVEKNGDYALGTTFRNTSTKFGGEVQSLADEPEEIQEYNRRGDLKKPPTDSASEDVVGELLSQTGDLNPPRQPVKVGESWSFDFPAKKSIGFPAAKVEYHLLEVRSTDQRIKITFDYRQIGTTEPMVARGTILLSGKDGSTISVESDIQHLKIHEELPAGSAKLSLKLKDGP
jgi:hypothetical protein